MLFVLMEFRSFWHEFIWTSIDSATMLIGGEMDGTRRKPWSKSKINPKRIAEHGAMLKDKWLMILARRRRDGIKVAAALFANNAFAEDIVVLTLTANMISADDRDAKSALWIRAHTYLHDIYNDDGSRM